MPARNAALNDAQKGDVAALWNRHAPNHASSVDDLGGSGGPSFQDNNFGGGGRGSGRGGRGRGRGGGRSRSGVAPTAVVTVSCEDEDYDFICRMYFFFRWVIDNIERKDTQQQELSSERDEESTHSGAGKDDKDHFRQSRCWESMMFLFQKVKAGSANSETTRKIVPRILGGEQMVTYNHASFLDEYSVYEESLPSDDNGQHSQQRYQYGSNSSSFRSYLHHKPDRALTSLGCAIGLNILTLWRRHHSFIQQNNQQHNHLSILHSAIYRPRFFNLASSLHIRMAQIRTSMVGRLISLRGTVTKARPKRLRVLDAGFTCSKCGIHQITKFMDGKYCSPTRCDDIKCRSQKFVLNRRAANFCDVQELKIQELREDFCEELDRVGHGEISDAGRAPRHIEVEVSHDLVDMCHAGDSIVVAGIVRAVNSALANGKGGKRAVETSTYKLYVVGHSLVNLTAEDGSRGRGQGTGKHGVDSENDYHGWNKRSKSSSASANVPYDDQQLQQIANIAHADHQMYSMPTRMAFPFDLLVRSICPNIVGNDLVKAGIILCLLGGTPQEQTGLEAQSGMTIRSNSHMLIVGDPGLGKSQMLLSADQVAARSVYVGGNTASSTGLTVSLSREPGGEMGIEAGALVLADRGVCCLDELDKMPKGHQDGLLEAMEQQQVSIAKAGIVASLPSRCSVIAAANPKTGRYNMDKSVAENLNMSGPLLSRFDLVFILMDGGDVDLDRRISGSIVGRLRRGDPQGGGYIGGGQGGKCRRFADAMDQFRTHRRVPLRSRLPWVAEFQKQPLPLQQLKDYIAYAREYCKPKMTDVAATVLQDYFVDLRHKKSKNSVPITTRQLEALIRLSQARAKACLRPFVIREDAEDVVELMIETVRQVHTDQRGNIDKSRGGAGGKSKHRRAFLEEMRTCGISKFEFTDLRRIAEKVNLPLATNVKDLLDTMKENGEILLKKYDGKTFYTLAL